jgi:acetoin utilization deacetylase AcuC-like enzyme
LPLFGAMVLKHALEHREEPSAKRLSTDKAKGRMSMSPEKKVKSQSRQLVIVLPDQARKEVEARHRLRWGKKIPAKQWHLLPLVRRNKKINKILQMDPAATEKQCKAQVMNSRRGMLSAAEGLYKKPMLDALRKPEAFDFKRNPEIWEATRAWVWNVRDPDSGSIVMQCDFGKKELASMVGDLKGDIGVLKSSVEQLLAKKTNDVVAVNTHPGHHAGPDRISNYCALNLVAIAAKLIKKKAPKMKLGVIDIDVHAGDGTHAFIQENPHLVSKFVSIHSPIRFCNMNSDLGENQSEPLKLNREREVAPYRYIAKIKETLDTWNKDHLDVIIVSMGFDTLKSDPEAGKLLGYTMLPKDFHEVGNIFAHRKEQILFLQEGGYNLNETAKAFEYLMKGFRKGRKCL